MRDELAARFDEMIQDAVFARREVAARPHLSCSVATGTGFTGSDGTVEIPISSGPPET